VNLVEGENFAPSFIALNENATLPTLEAGGKVYTSTEDVTGYLVKNAPTKVKGGNSKLIQKIHEDKYDPNFALLFARDAAELAEKGAGFPKTFVQNRTCILHKVIRTAD
jgi:glutathione S-transferase